MSTKSSLSCAVTWRILLLFFVLYLIPCFFTLPPPAEFNPPSDTPPGIVHLDPEIPENDSAFLRLHEEQIEAGLAEFDSVHSRILNSIAQIKEKVAELTNYFSSQNESGLNELPNLVLPEPLEIDSAISAELSARAQREDELPLFIRSVRSDAEAAGASAIRMLLRWNPAERLEEGVERDSEGGFCITGRTAVFTFWAPYPLWAGRFVVANVTGARDVQLFLGLDKEVVWESPREEAKDGVVEFKVGSVRFRDAKLRTFAEIREEMCIGDLTAFAPARVE
jgi:hypothetical protein